MRTTAAAEVEILVTLVQVLEGGKGVAGGGGGGAHLGSTTVEEKEEWEDSVHFEFLSSTLTAISSSPGRQSENKTAMNVIKLTNINISL